MCRRGGDHARHRAAGRDDHRLQQCRPARLGHLRPDSRQRPRQDAGEDRRRALRPVRDARRDRVHRDAVLAGDLVRQGRRRAAVGERAAREGRLLHVSRARPAGAARRRDGDEVRARGRDLTCGSRDQHRPQQGRCRQAGSRAGLPRADAGHHPVAGHRRSRIGGGHQRREGRARREPEHPPHVLVERRGCAGRQDRDGADRRARRLGSPRPWRVLPPQGGTRGRSDHRHLPQRRAPHVSRRVGADDAEGAAAGRRVLDARPPSPRPRHLRRAVHRGLAATTATTSSSSRFLSSGAGL